MATNSYNITNYSDTLMNCVLIDGLTPDIIKRRYIWILNAVVENAVIGEDDYGLVWYSGTWKSGEWEDGTWYSGIWEDGEWKNGKFYSYRFDTKQLLLRNIRVLEKDNPIYSQFLNGIWRRGDFYNGYFGPDVDDVDWDNMLDIQILYHGIRWESGSFYNGIFRNAVWLGRTNISSVFHNGIFYNSQWTNGTFMNGTFQGSEWWYGDFTGGDFTGCPNLNKVTHWWNGNFNQTNSNIRSRFGCWDVSGSTEYNYTSVIWHDGSFYGGEFHSGMNISSGKTQISDNNNRTVWEKGNWFNGTWYGGTHVDGIFYNGYWLSGIWCGGIFDNGSWLNGFWSGGTINDGLFTNGIFLNLTFNDGKFGYIPSAVVSKSLFSVFNYISKPPKKYIG